VRVRVVTPRGVVVEASAVHVRGEDPTGSFGILARHADFVTALGPSVLVYRDESGREHFVAVRSAMLTVRGGSQVDVLAREAVASDDLASLERDVLRRFRESDATEQRAHRGLSLLEGALSHRVAEYFRQERAIGAEPPEGRWGR
jgi:F-type H+-transporting ATPase subunit epsilon